MPLVVTLRWDQTLEINGAEICLTSKDGPRGGKVQINTTGQRIIKRDSEGNILKEWEASFD